MQMFPTCGLWAGLRSLSSCLCCCRQTRVCVWACCSWTCWAIAFSFSGYNWASRERIWQTEQRRKVSAAYECNTGHWVCPGIVLYLIKWQRLCLMLCLFLTWSSSIILTDRSFSSCCLSSIISLLKSSVFSSSRMSGEPIPSSFSSARLLFGEEPLNS